MSVVYLISAIVLEVGGTTCMKLSVGFSKFWPSVLVFVLYGLSLSFLTLALKRFDVSVAYAVWAGLGTALIALIGVLWFKEPAGAMKITSLALIVVGVIGLNLAGGAH